MNKTIKNCPKGFPFALKIKDVTPINEAINVRKFSLSKRQNESKIVKTETLHKTTSAFDKLKKYFFCF